MAAAATVKASDVPVGDPVRARSGSELTVTRIDEGFIGNPDMLAFVETPKQQWFKMPALRTATSSSSSAPDHITKGHEHGEQPSAVGNPRNGRDRTDVRSDLGLTESGVVSAVGSRSQGSADRFADAFGIAAGIPATSRSWPTRDVDVVYVATPHPMHRDNAILALRAGKPVLVEKPFAMNAAEAAEIVDGGASDGTVRDGGDVDAVLAAHRRRP